MRLKSAQQQLPASYKATSLFPQLEVSLKQGELTLSGEQQRNADVMRRYVIVDVNSQSELNVLLSSDAVEVATKNRRIPLHDFGLTHDSLSSDQYALAIIGAKNAWKYATGKGIVVGVIDTGIDWAHTELRDRLAVRAPEDVNGDGRFQPWASTVQIDGVFGDLNGRDDDGNGYVDDVIGYDVVDQDVRNLGDDRVRDPIPYDEQGHGTSVAGVICAHENNTTGIAGLAYDARVVSIRAFDATGNAEEDDIASALVYAAVNGVDIINMSFGDGIDSPAMRDAVHFAASMGCVLISSAGNTGTVSRQFPAGYDEVVAVAATTSFDERAPFSSTGSIIDMSAPGEAIITTRVGGGFRRASGTSFSAPYVAAACALLLEQDNKRTSAELKTLLQESSHDLGERGWDALFGAGRLQVDAAMISHAPSLVQLTAPVNESEINAVGAPLVVSGSTNALQFMSYEVQIGKGAEPAQWTSVATSNTTVKNGRLASIDLSGYSTGDHVVRLIVTLKNGRTLEERRRIRVLNNDTLLITNIEVLNAWSNDRRVALLTVETSRPTYMSVGVSIMGGRSDSLADVRRLTRIHSLPIDPSPWGTRGTLNILCTADNGDTIGSTRPFDIGDVAFSTTSATTKSTAPFAGYVLNDVRDVYADGKETFVMSDLSSTGFGSMLTVQRDVVGWGYKDSTLDVWIPRGMGDANGNGITEVFAHVVGKGRLFEARDKGGNPFESTIFLDETGRNNAAGMADIDGDGKEELLMLSDSGCVVSTFRDGLFVRLGTAVNPTPPLEGNASNRVDEISVAAGDFDGDGNIEIAFSDTDGDLVISEYSNGTFTTEFTYESIGAGGSGYVSSGDVDGNGIDDVVIGVPDASEPNSSGDYGRQVWTYRMFTSTGADTYVMKWQDHIHGLRYGIGYRSGVDVSQVDMSGGKDIVVCAFARLFVFSWRDGAMRPAFYRNNVVSPRFLVHDFDKNGKNELGFGITEPEFGYMTSFQFVEFDKDTTRIATPNGINAASINDHTAQVNWMPVDGASAYRIFIASEDDGLFRVIDTVTATQFAIDTLRSTMMYSFRVSALSETLKESFRSSIVSVNAGNQHRPLSVDKSSWTHSQLTRGIQYRVSFDGAIQPRNITPSTFVVLDSAGAVLSVGVTATCASDTDVVVTSSSLRIPFTGSKCQVYVGSILDARGIPTASQTFSIDVNADTTAKELYLIQLTLLDGSRAHLKFSQPVSGNATEVVNYELQPTGMIESVAPVDDSTVLITFGSNPPLAALGSQYSITALNVTATDGTPMTTGAGNTMSFVITAPSLENVFVYPQPAMLSQHNSVTFANLTQQAEVEVLDQRFVTVRRIKEADGNGGASWDLKDEAGNTVPPGMYFYRVTGTNETSTSAESGLRKLMIRR